MDFIQKSIHLKISPNANVTLLCNIMKIFNSYVAALVSKFWIAKVAKVNVCITGGFSHIYLVTYNFVAFDQPPSILTYVHHT